MALTKEGSIAALECRVQIEHTFLIAKDDNDSIAWAKVCRRANGVLWLTGLWVAAGSRGQGYASALMRVVLRECGHETIYLEVAPYADRPMDSAALTAFYKRFDFHPTDVPGVLCCGWPEKGL